MHRPDAAGENAEYEVSLGEQKQKATIGRDEHRRTCGRSWTGREEGGKPYAGTLRCDGRVKYVRARVQLQNLPTNQMFVAWANLLGLQDWAAARGVPQAKSNQCLSDQKMINREVQLTSDVNNQYPSFEGTPSFVINGELLKATASWDKLKPQLDSALK